MEESVVRISKDKETELEFQVKVQGTEDLSADTVVRFVIAGIENIYDMVFRAERTYGDSWKVKIPPLVNLSGDSYDVRIEVTIDNYYFEPAHGKVHLLSEPRIIITTPHETKRIEKEVEKEEKVEERVAQAAGDSGDSSAPTTKLLKPEPMPKETHREEPEKEDKGAKLFDIKPGEGAQQPQDDGKEKEEELTEGFNPQRIAEQIIMDTLGLSKAQRSQVEKKPGYLFKKDANGKPVIAALSDPSIKAKLHERQRRTKEEKVKAILKELSSN